MVNKPALLNDCLLHDKDRLRHEEALAILTKRVGRVISQPVHAPRNVLLTDNSAVDGYASAHKDYLAQGGSLAISQWIAAGDRDLPSLTPARQPASLAKRPCHQRSGHVRPRELACDVKMWQPLPPLVLAMFRSIGHCAPLSSLLATKLFAPASRLPRAGL